MQSDELLQLLTRGRQGELSAIRSIIRLQPSGGAGEKIFPPTYDKGAYAFETRRIDGHEIKTVLLDSVQSMANRFEEVLLEAFRDGRIAIPVFQVSIQGHEPVTSFTAPHRIHDAILRDSSWNGQLFRESENGRRLINARAWNAAAFFEYAPHALLLGTWDSQGGGGVNTAKIARSLVSEIIALDVIPGVRTSSRVDPLGIKKVKDVIVETADAAQWRFVDPGEKAQKVKYLKPSEINHGNVVPTITDPEKKEPGGVTFREAVQTTVLSLTQLRKLRFPDASGAISAERDAAGRAAIAALGLLAITLQQEEGYQLRSRCHLVPVETPSFEVIGRTEQQRERFQLDSATAEAALKLAVGAAAEQGLKWHPGIIELQPRPDLVKQVAYSDRATPTQGE
jgi:CRISPR-associated protein Csb1